MRHLTYFVAMSLDGYIAHQDGSFGGFVWDEDFVQDFLASQTNYGAVLMGRKTYEVGLREGKTSPYPAMRQYLFSRTLENSPDHDVELVSTDALAKISSLKDEEGKGIWLCGGADLASQCFRAGLVDRLIIKLNPTVFGDGIALFEGVVPMTRLELTDTKTHGCGIVTLSYRVLASSSDSAS